MPTFCPNKKRKKRGPILARMCALLNYKVKQIKYIHDFIESYFWITKALEILVCPCFLQEFSTDSILWHNPRESRLLRLSEVSLHHECHCQIHDCLDI